MNGNENNGANSPKGARLAFGILMIFFYVGLGLLFIFNVFSIDSKAISYVMGGLLCAYGVWRGVRLYKGWS